MTTSTLIKKTSTITKETQSKEALIDRLIEKNFSNNKNIFSTCQTCVGGI